MSQLRCLSLKDLRRKRAEAEKEARATKSAGERAHHLSVAKVYTDEIKRREQQ